MNLLGNLAAGTEDWDKAVQAFEAAAKHSPGSVPALYGLGAALHRQQQYVQAMEVYQRVLGLIGGDASSNGLKSEVWASIGHCALLLDDLARAFSAFQQALQILGGAPRDPAIWFAIGLLYDRYGADELAREAFLITLRHEQAARPVEGLPSLREREIYYRLGLIYMNLKKWNLSRECFEWGALWPPAGLGSDDVRFYLGVLYSIQGDVASGQPVFESIGGRLLDGAVQPHPPGTVAASMNTQLKSRQILGWYQALCNGPEGVSSGLAIAHTALDQDPSISFGWYCVGRISMLARDYTQAYEAYQQAVYRDGTNASFWNSIGILYYDIGQFRDALDAYSRSIHLAPFVADTWWNLGVLYETSHGQMEDALDAYGRAAELDPECSRITDRIALLKKGKSDHKDSTEKETPVRPVEYCPMPFFSRPVLLGSASSIPPQRPALGQAQLPIGSNAPQQQQQHIPVLQSGMSSHNMGLSPATAILQRQTLQQSQFQPQPPSTCTGPPYHGLYPG